jgi:cyclophilin family peptidyl-prolyl cis-trans isomerase
MATRPPQARQFCRLACCSAVVLSLIPMLIMESRLLSPGVPTAPFSDGQEGLSALANSSSAPVGKTDPAAGSSGGHQSGDRTKTAPDPELGQVPPPQVAPQHLANTPDELFVVHTHVGNITLKFRADKAPRHVAYMKELIARHAYDGMCWYRAERNFVLQGGLRNAAGRVFNAGLPSPPLEYSLPNRRGFVNMARWEAPDTAGGDFCIILRDSPHLDRTGTSGYAAGFTVWAEVVQGMEVADRISNGATKTVGGLNFLRDPVTFESVSLV